MSGALPVPPTLEQFVRTVVTYPPDAILDKEHIALMLGVSVRTVEGSGIPYHRVGAFRRYICREVLDYVAQQTQDAA